jgi:biopolymer transport protein ExbD
VSSVQTDSGQDFDLNIAPIIDCFTVLITYLLVSASFLSLSVFEVGVAATGDSLPIAQETPKDPPLSLLILMKQVGSFDIKLTGGPRHLAESFLLVDSDSLRGKLKELVGQMPELKEASLTAEPNVHYKEMIKLIEGLQKIIPKTFIAGT